MSQLNLIGRTIHHFKILSQLGRGGMAIVYKAHQTDLERDIALKILPPEMTFDQSYIARFQQEARAAARLEHSHIVPIYEIGSADGFYYIAMKYIAGETLKETIESEAPMPLARVLELLEPIGKALDYAHKKSVVHRDIKPANVMVTPDGWVYLADFGLARGTTGESAGLTQAGTIMGTPEYMSPEQAQGLVVGPQSDLYALGIMIYEMLSKGMPFSGDNPQSILFARVMRPPTPPSAHRPTISGKLEDVIMKALARQPEARFGSAADLFSALREAGGLGVPGQASSGAGTLQRGQSGIAIQPAQPAQQPVYPQQPANPPSQPSQTSYPPQPGASYQPAQSTGYPPQPAFGSQPSYPPFQAAGSQPTYLATPNPAPVAAHYPAGAPAQPVSYQPAPPSYPSAGHPAPLRRTSPGQLGIWIGLALAALLGIAAIIYFTTRTPAIQTALERGEAALAGQQKLVEAEQAFTQAAQENSQDSVAHERLALIYLLRGQFAEAISMSETAINLAPTSAAPHAWQSLAYAEQNQPNEALAQAEEAIHQEQSSSLGYLARAINRADLAVFEQDQATMDYALQDVDEAISSASDEQALNLALAHYARAHVLHRKYATALSGTSNPDDLVAGVEAATTAIATHRQVPEFHAMLGYLYTSQFEYEAAIAAFNTALEQEPEFAPAYLGMGRTHFLAGSQNQAVDALHLALELDPTLTYAYLELAYAYDNVADPQAASQILNEGLSKVRPEDQPVLQEALDELEP